MTSGLLIVFLSPISLASFPSQFCKPQTLAYMLTYMVLKHAAFYKPPPFCISHHEDQDALLIYFEKNHTHF